MKHFIIDLFKIETKPRKGLLALEWAVLAYLVLTTLVILFTYTRLENPESMLWGRLRIVAMTMGLWIVYRLVPCKLTQLARVLAQCGLLAWWYPDTYEINKNITRSLAINNQLCLFETLSEGHLRVGKGTI